MSERPTINAEEFDVIMDNPEMQLGWDIYEERILRPIRDADGDALPEWALQLLKITFLRGFRCGHLVGKTGGKVTRQ